MTYYWLTAAVGRESNWILFRQPKQIVLRDRYVDMACCKCGKLDEYVAIARGIDNDVKMRCRSDVVCTDDGFIVLSQRARDVLSASQVLGLDYFELPGGRFFVAIPTTIASVDSEIIGHRSDEDIDFVADTLSDATPMRDIIVDVDKCGMEHHDRCNQCGRYKDTLYWPERKWVTLPKNPMVIATIELIMEKGRTRILWLLVSEMVADVLRRAGLKGFEFEEVR